MNQKMVYHIRDWQSRYEVNSKGGGADDGDKLRLRPLEFVRWQVRGRDIGIGLRRLNKLAGEEFAPAAFGVFAKLVEIAAQERRGKRGFVLTSDGDPMTHEDIAEATGWSEGVITKALTLLMHERIQWVESVILPEFPELPEIPAPYITEPNRTEQNRTKAEPKTRGRARTASAVSDSADSARSEAGSTPLAPADPEPTTRRNTEPASPAPEPARPATITGSAVPEYPQNAPRASCAVSGNLETQTKTDTNNLNEAIAQIQRQPSRDYLNDLFRRIKRVSNDPKHWVEWWKQALPQVVANDRLHAALTEALGYAEDCANPATRQVKGLGALSAPGAYITSKLLDAAGSAGVRLPKLPTREDAA